VVLVGIFTVKNQWRLVAGNNKTASLQLASIDTRVEERDHHLKSRHTFCF